MMAAWLQCICFKKDCRYYIWCIYDLNWLDDTLLASEHHLSFQEISYAQRCWHGHVYQTLCLRICIVAMGLSNWSFPIQAEYLITGYPKLITLQVWPSSSHEESSLSRWFDPILCITQSRLAKRSISLTKKILWIPFHVLTTPSIGIGHLLNHALRGFYARLGLKSQIEIETPVCSRLA